MDKKRIAVIGSGISGLSAAWLLKDSADVTLYEADSRFGGHSHTHAVNENGRQVLIDTGFMVFNRPNYPLLTKLFNELKINTYETDMSFSVSLNSGKLEYAGNNLNTLFAQRSNLVRPSFLKMLGDIIRFNRATKKLLESPHAKAQLPLEQFLKNLGTGRNFRDNYLYPMAAAIWSCPKDAVGEFPAYSFAQFFSNHGLINLINRPQWETVEGGSQTYVNRLTKDLGKKALANTPVYEVKKCEATIAVCFKDGGTEHFDDVVFACHSDQAAKLLKAASPKQTQLLNSVPYQKNTVFLHSDETLMPVRRKTWASWNYSNNQDSHDSVSVTYWMNSLQNLNTQKNYFVSLNPVKKPAENRIEAEFNYEHPVFNGDSLGLTQRLEKIQGEDGIWFCGAWTGYGFHEDGIRSGVDVALKLGAPLPWEEQIKASRKLRTPSTPSFEWQNA